MKKEYISPSMNWTWVGLSKEIADFDVIGGHVSTQTVKEEKNAWSDDFSSDEASTNTLWEKKW